MILKSESSLQISKPIDEVFDAIVDSKKLTKYFICESSGDLEEGKDVEWKFPEFEERFPIRSVKISAPNSISFIWDPETFVQIHLEAFSSISTVVRVEENGKPLNDDNLKWLISNVGGWANFLASLKAYIEYGIELRKGAYDFMRKES